jgi:hypothetical protein
MSGKYVLDFKERSKTGHLSEECINFLLKANPKFEEVIDAWIDDPRYYGK